MIAGSGGSGPNEQRGAGDKESSRDFALWKADDVAVGGGGGAAPSSDVSWESPVFGKGRPG